MSYVFTIESFRKEYLHRVAEGELLPKWSDFTAVSMLIQEINKPRQKDCDFGNYSFYDVCWLDFRADIFSSDEVLDISDTGFQSRMIDEQSCYQCLKSFVEQIKNPEIKISILKFFLSDEFKAEILEKNYIAYRNSSEMIQEQCAIVLGEVNRAIHGSIAPDLANLPDDYGNFEEESEKPKNGNKQIIDYNGASHVLELYQLPSKEENSQSYTQQSRLPYCTYIVPNAPKTRDEIEADLVRTSKKSATIFCSLLERYEQNHYLDFRGETGPVIFEYLKERYNLPYLEANFLKAFRHCEK